MDGLFSFENAHDVFFPLVAAAPACSLDLLTNVAIAFPRNPMHLAHAAYDLHLLSEGRFRLGLGSQVRAHIERRFDARWDKPVAQMREWVEATKAILTSWQNGSSPRVPWRLHQPHAHDSGVRSGSQSPWHAEGAGRCPRSADDPDGGRSGRRDTRHAVQQSRGTCASGPCPQSNEVSPLRAEPEMTSS